MPDAAQEAAIAARNRSGHRSVESRLEDEMRAEQRGPKIDRHDRSVGSDRRLWRRCRRAGPQRLAPPDIWR